jgi:hypothetical protein
VRNLLSKKGGKTRRTVFPYGFCKKGLLRMGIVKSFMKNRLGICGKTRETLPLEGGGKRVGVKGLRGIIAEDLGNTLFTPHPGPLPQGERGDNF